MATSASKTGIDIPVFSYAQAAKGFAPIPSNQSHEKPNNLTPTSSEAKSAETDSNSIDEEVFNRTSLSTNVRNPSVAPETPDVSNKEQSVVDSDINASQNILSGVSSPSLATASTSTLPKEDDLSIAPNGQSDLAWDKKSQASAPAEGPDDTPEDNKEGNTEDALEKPEAPKELKAAPIPSINIWQQRREAQDAKARANALLKPVSTPTSKGPTAGPTSHSSSDTRADNPKWGGRRKTSETVESSSGNARDKKRAVDGGKSLGINKPCGTAD